MIQIYNTLTQKKAPLEPIVPGKVGLYVCGMTVYDYCHLGHARVLVAFDVIVRYLRYRGFEVTYIRNITDIDDKILRRAHENEEAYTKLTERMIAAMHEDERALGIQAPNREPRATGHIEEIIDMIQTLMHKGYAYLADNGDVYFAVDRFEDYGKLSKRKLEDLLAGARIDINEAKKSPADFALWKAAEQGDSSWSSPWGYGRPGWHIECSAMSTACLGETFDIHGGGPDLVFPHHENEIAQSEAATGKPFVNVWMHAGAVRVNKEKMSKSLGNFFTIREILAQNSPEVVRYFLVSSHYRSQIDYSPDSLAEAQTALKRFYSALRGLQPRTPDQVTVWEDRFQAAMDDDFNTREALAVLFQLVGDINRARRMDRITDAAALAGVLVRLGGVLGLFQQDPEAYLKSVPGGAEGELGADEIEAEIAARNAARKNKDFTEADRIRDRLKEQGVILDDTRDGTTWRRA